jgi:hypothetical protein
MTASKHPLGQGMLGQGRVGDGLASGIRPLSQALGLTYTIANSQHSQALGLTYTILKGGSANLLLYYTITPNPVFSINGDGSIIAPDQLTYVPKNVVARNLVAQPLIQGYYQIIWSYTNLQVFEAQHLLSFYNPANPQVVLTYPDEDGLWVQRQASILPPNYGSWETVSVLGLQISFLILPN